MKLYLPESTRNLLVAELCGEVGATADMMDSVHEDVAAGNALASAKRLPNGDLDLPKNVWDRVIACMAWAYEDSAITASEERKKAVAARELGSAGGRSKSAAKATASRANGAKGGRPRKADKPVADAE